MPTKRYRESLQVRDSEAAGKAAFKRGEYSPSGTFIGPKGSERRNAYEACPTCGNVTAKAVQSKSKSVKGNMGD